jgi:L-gulonolactone oxidase
VTIDESHPDFRAAQVALGSFGIVYSVKLRVVPEFNVYIDKRYVPVGYVLEEFDDLQASYEFLEIFWFPLQSKMWLYLMNRTDSSADKKSDWARLMRRLNTAMQEFMAGGVLPLLAKYAHQLTPFVNRLASRMANKVEASVETASNAFHHQKAYARALDVSYSLRAEDAAEAWRKAIDLVDEYARADRYPVNFALHCRFTGKSDAWLGANHGRPTVFIEVATAAGTPHWRGFFEQMENRWAAFDGARPHWGKIFWRAEAVADQYGRMSDFLAARERWDPGRTFLNDFLEHEVFRLHPPTTVTPQATPQLAPPPPA